MSEPLTSQGFFKPKALDELSRDTANTRGIPPWAETDLPTIKERRNDDAWQAHDELMLKVCQEQEELATMDLNMATLSIRPQLKRIEADKDKAKRREANQVKVKTRLDKAERRKRAKLSMG